MNLTEKKDQFKDILSIKILMYVLYLSSSIKILYMYICVNVFILRTIQTYTYRPDLFLLHFLCVFKKINVIL